MLRCHLLWCSASFTVRLSQPYVTAGKTVVFTIQTFVRRVMSLLFYTLFRFVLAFLPRSNCLLMSWLSTVILKPKRRKSVTISTFHLSPFIYHAVLGPDAMIVFFSTFSLKPALSLFSFTLIKKLFGSSLLSAIRVASSACLWLLMFLRPTLVPAQHSS